jgi:hypothetical protein
MFPIYATVCAFLMIVGFAIKPELVSKWRARISMSALLGACSFLTAAGFSYSGAIGFFALSAVLLLIALLFGYDRG